MAIFLSFKRRPSAFIFSANIIHGQTEKVNPWNRFSRRRPQIGIYRTPTGDAVGAICDRPSEKHITNRFLWAGDHRSPLQYVLKLYDKLKFDVLWHA